MSEADIWWGEQLELRQRIRRVCRENPAFAQVKPKKGTFMFSPAHRLLFCRNAKVINCLNMMVISFT